MGFSSLFRLTEFLINKATGEDLRPYESAFAQHLGTAFSDRKALRKKLVQVTKLYTDKRYTNALTTLDRLLPQCQTSEDHRAVQLFTGLCHTACGNHPAAITAYEALVDKSPNSSTGWSNLGQLLRKEGAYRRAEECFQTAISRDPHNHVAHNNLATLYIYMGRYEEAIPCAHRSLELKQNMYQAASALSIAYLATGDIAQSQHYYQAAVAAGEDPRVLKDSLERVRNGDFRGLAVSQDMERVLHEWTRRTSRPTARLAVTLDGQGRSRVGGPSLGQPPLDSRGKPMRLLCAIYCDEVRNVPDFPETGLLRFYIADNETYGMDPRNPTIQKDFRVLYTPSDVGLAPVEQSRPSKRFPVQGCYPIHFVTALQTMGPEDYRFAQGFDSLLREMGQTPLEDLSEDTMEAIRERFTLPGHKVGGYPHFVQTDPRDNNPALEKYDTLLLLLDSHLPPSPFHIMFGDVGTCCFFIPREKLRALDFSDVLYWWDCQ